MREILFRSKRIDNGEWVVGSLLVSKTGKTYIRYYPAGDSKTSLQTAVAPNTVGQYTGLTDKNGKLIFEEDIIRRLDVIQVERETGRVAFDEVCCCFYLTVNGGIGRRGIFRDAEYEIIGNIHDNPELLEVSK